MQSFKGSKMVADRVLTTLFLHFNLTRYVWMFFTWLLWKYHFGKWINIVNLFHLNTWNVGEVLNTINAQLKSWFTLSLQKFYTTLTIEKKSVLVGNYILRASQLQSKHGERGRTQILGLKLKSIWNLNQLSKYWFDIGQQYSMVTVFIFLFI